MSAVTSVYKNVRSIRTAIKDVGRLRQIAGILAKHGFGALVQRMELTDVIGLRKLVAQGQEESQRYTLAERLRISIEDLGPTFIKLGQILSTRSDLVGPDIIEQFQELQDNVPPMPWDAVRGQVEAALGHTIEESFTVFEKNPIASASIAQVHRAELKDGTEVVVKIQRANIEDRIQSDLNILHFMAARAERLVPELRLIDPVGIVLEFERALGKELSFENELANIEKFHTNFEGFEGVKIPRTYPELSGRTMLTMELVRGVKVTEAPAKQGADPYVLAPRMLRALFKMVFEDGLFHGDLHPGNILITADHTIALIDFGLVGRLLPRQREDILDLLIGMSKEDYDLVARVFFDLGIKVPGVKYDFVAFENDVIEVMEAHLAGKTLQNIDVQGFFADLVNGAIKHQIKMPPTYTLVFKALMTVEGIGKSLAPNVNFVEEAKPFVSEMLIARYSPDRMLREGMETLTSTSRFLRSMSQTGPRLLRDVELGRLTFKTESDQIMPVLSELQKSTNRLIRAMVFGSSAVAGTLALEAQGPTILGWNAISFGAYIIAAVAGLPLVFSLLSRR